MRATLNPPNAFRDSVARMLKIRAERLRRNWSQTQLAARANLSSSQVSQIETGRIKPYPRQIHRLARALEIPADELLVSVKYVDR